MSIASGVIHCATDVLLVVYVLQRIYSANSIACVWCARISTFETFETLPTCNKQYEHIEAIDMPGDSPVVKRPSAAHSILSQYYCERIVLVICKRMMSHRWNALKRAASYYGEWIGLSDRCSTVVRTSRTSTRAARLKRTGARIAGRSLCKSLWQSLISIFPCY